MLCNIFYIEIFAHALYEFENFTFLIITKFRYVNSLLPLCIKSFIIIQVCINSTKLMRIYYIDVHLQL